MSLHSQRIDAVRTRMREAGVDAFLIPYTDRHQTLMVPVSERRLEWLSGFSGDYGFAILTDQRLLLYPRDWGTSAPIEPEIPDDVAYDVAWLDYAAPCPFPAWLATQPAGSRVGFDPWLHSIDDLCALRDSLPPGARLVPLAENPIDSLWHDRMTPVRPAFAMTDDDAGEPASLKRRRIGSSLPAAGVDAVLLTRPDSIGWLLNIRGHDHDQAPLLRSFALLHADGRCLLFLNPDSLDTAVRAHLGSEVETAPDHELYLRLTELAASGIRIGLDPMWTVAAVASALEAADAQWITVQDPCALPRACRNEREIEQTRSTHLRDSAAIARFLTWIDEHALAGSLTECSAATHLDDLRRDDPLYWGTSFKTISAVNAHAIVQLYSPTPATDAPLRPGDLYLIDSGGHYVRGGTTDVTRTLWIGNDSVDEEIADRYTRVLQGLIAVSAARFPEGTTGEEIDALARRALWEIGLDYDSLTGHGLGHFNEYLDILPNIVRPGTYRGSAIERLPADLRPGMVVTIEPAYYATGRYGIRLENDLLVVDHGEGAGGRRVLGFETLTLVPFDRRLIRVEMLQPREREWLNVYHRQVQQRLEGLVDQQVGRWLLKQAIPL